MLTSALVREAEEGIGGEEGEVDRVGEGGGGREVEKRNRER